MTRVQPQEALCAHERKVLDPPLVRSAARHECSQVASVLLQQDPFGSDDTALTLTHPVSNEIVINSTRFRELLLEEVPFRKKYLTSMYWALTMVMKSPWLSPSMESEQLFACISLILGAMLFAMCALHSHISTRSACGFPARQYTVSSVPRQLWA